MSKGGVGREFLEQRDQYEHHQGDRKGPSFGEIRRVWGLKSEDTKFSHSEAGFKSCGKVGKLVFH